MGFHAVARGRITEKDTVAIFGCGGVGLGAIAASAFRNAKTIAIDVDDAKLRIAREAGASHTINTRTEPLHEKLQELTGGLGPDVVIEAIGLPATFTAAVEEVAFTGRVVYIGYAKDMVSYETRLFVQKELDILGSRNALPEDFAEVIRMLQQHRFPVKSAITRVVPFEDAPSAFTDWSSLVVLRRQMSVASRHRNCFVTSKFLHCSQVYILHDQSADEGMAKVVPAKVLHLGLFERQFKPSPGDC